MQVQASAKARETWGNGTVPPRKVYRARLQSVNDVSTQLARLYREARAGLIDVGDASRLANILSILGRMIGDSDLETRLEALEAKGV